MLRGRSSEDFASIAWYQHSNVNEAIRNTSIDINEEESDIKSTKSKILDLEHTSNSLKGSREHPTRKNLHFPGRAPISISSTTIGSPDVNKGASSDLSKPNTQNSGFPSFYDSHPNVEDEITSELLTRTDGTRNFYLFPAEKKVLFTLLGIISVVIIFVLNQQGFAYLLTSFLTWVKAIGVWGNLMFVLVFVLISFPVVLGGYTPLVLGAGAIYGVLLGTLTVSIASTLGACVSFSICRYFTRSWFESKIKGKEELEVFMALFLQAKENKMVSLMARLSPIPFGLQNSFFALTEISFQDFLFSTWLGLLPFQILWTYLGTTLRNISKISSGELELDGWQKASLVLQLVVAVGLTVYFGYLLRQLKEEQKMKGKQSVIPIFGQSVKEENDIEMGNLLSV